MSQETSSISLGQDNSPSWMTIFLQRHLFPWPCLQNANSTFPHSKCQTQNTPTYSQMPYEWQATTQCWLGGSPNLGPQCDKHSSVTY